MAVSARARSLIYSQSQHFTRWCKKLGLFRCPGFWGAGLARLFYWFELSCACGVWLGRNGSPNWPPNLVLGRRDFPIQFPFTDGSFGSNFIDLTKKVISQFVSLNYVRSKSNTSKIRANISRFCRSRSGGFSTRPHFENFGGYTVKSSSTGHSHIYIYIYQYVFNLSSYIYLYVCVYTCM